MDDSKCDGGHCGLGNHMQDISILNSSIHHALVAIHVHKTWCREVKLKHGLAKNRSFLHPFKQFYEQIVFVTQSM